MFKKGPLGQKWRGCQAICLANFPKALALESFFAKGCTHPQRRVLRQTRYGDQSKEVFPRKIKTQKPVLLQFKLPKSTTPSELKCPHVYCFSNKYLILPSTFCLFVNFFFFSKQIRTWTQTLITVSHGLLVRIWHSHHHSQGLIPDQGSEISL